MAEEVLQKMLEVVNNMGVEQFNNTDTKYMFATTGGVVTTDKKSPKLNIKINTVQCLDKEVLVNLSSPENKVALEDFTNSVIRSQNIGNAFNNVALPVEVLEFMAADINTASAQCLRNYSAAETKDSKKIAQR